MTKRRIGRTDYILAISESKVARASIEIDGQYLVRNGGFDGAKFYWRESSGEYYAHNHPMAMWCKNEGAKCDAWDDAWETVAR